MKKYKCGICGEEYSREDLKIACESLLLKPETIPIGGVFKCGDGLIGIIHEIAVFPQTHKIFYSIVRGDIEGRESCFVPLVKVDDDYLNSAQTLSKEEFELAVREFSDNLMLSTESQLTKKLRELNLTRFVR